MVTSSTKALETILNADKLNDASWDCHGLEGQQVEAGTVREETEDLIAITLQKMIADEAKQKVQHALEGLSELVEKGVEQRFRAAAIRADSGICTVVQYAMGHVALDQIETKHLGDTIIADVD